MGLNNSEYNLQSEGMRAYFVYNNLKQNPFVPGDAPLPGFELLTWEHESFIVGSLWDIGPDCSYTTIGQTEIHGQIWLEESRGAGKELEYFSGVRSGLTELVTVPVRIKYDGVDTEFDVCTFRLKQILPTYKLLRNGSWWIKKEEI